MRNDDAPVTATLERITGDENLLLLVASPADETLGFGGLIAASCRRGRPPFVMVLGDGTGSYPGGTEYTPDSWARLRERETRAAVACLGLPRERLLMAGLYDGHIPESGAMFDRVVKAVTLVMWARDCNVITAPSRDGPAGSAAAYRVAEAVAGESGVGLLAMAGDAEEGSASLVSSVWRLDVSGHMAAKRAALSAHASLPGDVVARDYEMFLRPV